MNHVEKSESLTHLGEDKATKEEATSLSEEAPYFIRSAFILCFASSNSNSAVGCGKFRVKFHQSEVNRAACTVACTNISPSVDTVEYGLVVLLRFFRNFSVWVRELPRCQVQHLVIIGSEKIVGHQIICEYIVVNNYLRIVVP